MIKRNIVLGLSILASTGLTACMTQDPAPVVTGRLSPYPSPTSTVIEPKVVNTVAMPSVTAAPVTVEAPTYHIVERGEGLYGIAKKYGSSVDSIMAANHISDPGALMVGQSLEIPGTTTTTTTTSTSGRYSLTAKYGTETETKPVTITKPVVTETKVVAAQPKATGGWTSKHVVQKGENAYRIALKYGTSLNTLLSKNGLTQGQGLNVGQALTVPSKGIDQMTTALAVSPSHADYGKTPNSRGDVAVALKSVSKEKPKPVRRAETHSIKRSPMMASGIPAKGMMWPAEGTLIKRFGTKKDGVKHTGINVKLPQGSPIYAADAGTVIYADDGLKSYGNLVLIQHRGGVVTAYGHNDTNKVTKGERVKKGQVVALAGTSGGVDTPQLHFEVRKNATPVNPLSMLPKK